MRASYRVTLWKCREGFRLSLDCFETVINSPALLATTVILIFLTFFPSVFLFT